MIKHKDKMKGQAREFLRKKNFDSEEAVLGGGERGLRDSCYNNGLDECHRNGRADLEACK